MIKTLIVAAVATAFSLGASAADTAKAPAMGASAPMAKSDTMAAKPMAKPAKHTSTKTAKAAKHPKKPASAPAA